MGCGKSTVGPLLADALGFSFVDLDDEIERHEDKSIKDIFNVSGERYFRSLEKSYLHHFIDNHETVFALGGGTVTIEGIIAELKKNGVLVYLKTDAEELIDRLRGHTHRPLLYEKNIGSMSEVELHRKINSLLQERTVYYQEADLIIETTQKPVDVVVELVLKALAGLFHNDESHKRKL